MQNLEEGRGEGQRGIGGLSTAIMEQQGREGGGGGEGGEGEGVGGGEERGERKRSPPSKKNLLSAWEG